MAGCFHSALRRALDVCLITLLAVVGCSLAVDPFDSHPRCELLPGLPDVCPNGLECREGRCQPKPEDKCDGLSEEERLSLHENCGDWIDNDCDGQAEEYEPREHEICGDTEDNDCDGNVDEGFDRDLDDYTWCGNTTDSEGGRETADCDDVDPRAYPGAPEVCDGVDNDCDDFTDEENAALCESGEVCLGQRCVTPSCAIPGSGAECLSGERCDLSTQRCVPDLPCTASPCLAHEYCDAVTNTCRRKERSQNGELCLTDGDCQSNTCIDAAALRLAEGTRVCGKACCNDSHCDPSERCFSSGTGARSCLPASMIPSTVLTQCTTDDVCPASELCGLNKSQSLASSVFESRPELVTSTCRPDEPLGLPLGAGCLDYPECDSKVCVQRRSTLLGVLGQVCSMPCGASKDCQRDFADAAGVASEDVYCRYIRASTGTSPDYASVCVVDLNTLSPEIGPGTFGAECSGPEECNDRGCVGATLGEPGHCTPTCCSNADCGRTLTDQPIACRPYAFGTSYEMRCQL